MTESMIIIIMTVKTVIRVQSHVCCVRRDWSVSAIIAVKIIARRDNFKQWHVHTMIACQNYSTCGIILWLPVEQIQVEAAKLDMSDIAS